MKLKSFLFLIICSCSIIYGIDTATVIFQNGVEDYSGCEDATISSQSNQNQGSSEKLNVKYEKCTT